MNEFSLIEKYFTNKTLSRTDVLLGIGDDAALLKVPDDKLLVSSMDTLVEGVHFLPDTTAFDLGYKALAVNLSDLAAMGAEPAWMMLALTVPDIQPTWMEEFTQGMFQLAHQYNVQLIGGDTTQGPLSITIQINGFVSPTEVLRRSGAKVGDKIYVSGTLGDAGLGLQVARNHLDLADEDKAFVLQRLNRPTPRVELGLQLRELASSAIDISDGLLADLGHILKCSGVGANIYADKLPLSNTLKKLPSTEAQQLALTAGDDYELCFTVSPEGEVKLITHLDDLNIPCICIGEIKQHTGLRITGYSEELDKLGFQHFNNHH